LLFILGPYINKKIQKKKIRENIKKYKNIGRKSQKYTNKKNIPERSRNYQRLVEEDQNIQD
jgi:hypothetical protein